MSVPKSLDIEIAVARATPTRRPGMPTVSVVVVSMHERAQLQAQLAPLVAQCDRANADLIVARGAQHDTTTLGKLYPGVRVVRAPAGATEAQLRSLAMVQATGDIVLFMDDRRTLPPDWLESVLAGLRGDATPDKPGAQRATGAPSLSVIVPVHQGAALLPTSLGALAASDLPRAAWELIVVDDASTDDSALVAAQYADIVVRLRGPAYGPAYARNRGFQVSRGESVVFVDADVRVHRSTLRRFVGALAEQPEVSAVFGSFDDSPPATGLVSQYRNLLQHHHHQLNAGDATMFWASCGAIRRSAFTAVGMYDEWRFRRPQIEDVDLGHRLRDLGHRTVLRPEIQGTHLKRWTFLGLLASELNDRGVPWMRLAADPVGSPTRTAVRRQRNVRRNNAALVWTAVPLVALTTRFGPLPLVPALGALGLVLFNNRRQFAFFRRHRGLGFALATVPLDLLRHCVNGAAMTIGWALRETVGEAKPAAAVQAFAEVGLETWPPVPRRSETRLAEAATLAGAGNAATRDA